MTIEQYLQARVMVLDGAMGTMIQGYPTDLLNLTQPDVITAIHRRYREAGADILKTNTFNSTVYEVNLAGAKLTRNAAGSALVAGCVGPTKELDAYHERARGLMDGGVDLLLLETVVDTINATGALSVFEKVFDKVGKRVPVMVSVTITGETTIEEFWNAISRFKILSAGINCSFGAQHMRPYVQELSRLATVYTTCHPSAGLPNASGGYDETPEKISAILREFAANGWVNIVGGCCGTTPEHIRAVAEAVRGLKPRGIPSK